MSGVLNVCLFKPELLRSGRNVAEGSGSGQMTEAQRIAR